jgi:hypothetical protein
MSIPKELWWALLSPPVPLRPRQVVHGRSTFFAFLRGLFGRPCETDRTGSDNREDGEGEAGVRRRQALVQAGMMRVIDARHRLIRETERQQRLEEVRFIFNLS